MKRFLKIMAISPYFVFAFVWGLVTVISAYITDALDYVSEGNIKNIDALARWINK